ncbi:hypothetical protein [Arthrobacter sp. Soil763]|uniref:hypothetical protein n=1 Tax=Arthrobacter sp. Soil763 TaxID=1736402 RepID=UPI0006FDB093|nr:hypothetical protein [Arthrobacter sp. Soil763]KRE77506.1 hypothetical protein ASG71_14520 [Arthrobacter sp. Soil763]
MNALWITLALLASGFAGWPVTALVFRLARTIDDRSDTRAAGAAPDATNAAPGAAPSGAAAVDGEITLAEPGPGAAAPAARSADGAPAPDAASGTAPASAGQAVPVSGTRILRGGAIIGVLERLAVSLAILTGQPVAIAYVVAIKGLGRFAELKETPVAAERFIIGTLTSLLWAAGVTALVKVLFLG